jgi:hypothetical protein
MPEQLPQHEPLNLSPEKLQRIADEVAKRRYIQQIDQEMGDDTPDIIGLRPSEYNVEEEIRVAVQDWLPRGSSREDVGPVLRQIDQLIEDAGGLEAYLAAEAERRALTEGQGWGHRLAQQSPEPESNPASSEIAPETQEQEVPLPENPNPKARRKFGRSILNRFSGPT